jgi:tetratricopeptide (TPR) repeat protein
VLEAAYPDRRAELAPVLALHFAAAEDWPKAIAYHRLAADHAQARYAHPEAVQHRQAAVDLLPPAAPPAERAARLEELGGALARLGDHLRALDAYAAALNAWIRQPQPERWGTARLHREILETLLAMASTVPVDELYAAIDAHAGSLLAAQALAAEAPAHPETVWTLVTLSWIGSRGWWREGGLVVDWDTAERCARQALALAESLDLPDARSAALGALGGVLYSRGQLRPRVEAALQRLALSRDARLTDVRERLNSLIHAGAALAEVGDYTHAIDHLQTAEREAAAVKAVMPQVYALRLQVQCWFSLDRWEAMLGAVEQIRALARQHSTQVTGPICFELALAAAVYRFRGRADLAPALLQESYAIMESIGGPPETWVRQQHY